MKIAITELEHLREEIKNCHQIIKDFQMKRKWAGLTDEELFEIVRSEGKVTKADAWEIVENLQAKLKELI
jgi:hypothetical protein